MNSIDIAVIAVVAISALIAFLRGFVREMLTVGSWIGATLVTVYGFPVLQSRFENWISVSKLAADVVCGAALFIGSLIVFSVFSHAISKFVRGSALTAVDRSLGLLFGLARGAVLVSLAYMIVIWLKPDMLKGARTAPMMARGAEILRSLAPKELADELSNQTFVSPAPSQPDDAGKHGTDPAPTYNGRQKDALQRLIDTTAGK